MGLHNDFPMAQFIAERVMEDTKKPDGLLHPSTDLSGCEISMCHRHDPDIETKPKSQAAMTRLLIGTLVHRWLEQQMTESEWDGIEFRCEVDMTPGLPMGWAGTADVLIGQFGDGVLSEPEFTLMDFKTIAGSGLGFIDLNVPKREQHYQVSAYFHAAEAMGYRMAPKVCIVHIPVSAAQYKEIESPIEQWMTPLPRNVVFGEMKRRSQMLKRYLAGEKDLPQPMARVQATRFNKRLNLTEHIEKDHWMTRFCDSPLCRCGGGRVEVISYDDSGVSAGSL